MGGRLITGLLIASLAGCASIGAPTRPPPEPVPAAPASSKPVVLNLMRDATHSAGTGQYAQAVLALERALRIEPRNPLLWHDLAKVRMQQQRYHQAAQLAAKSNALSRDRRLHAANWRLIAAAHDGAGEPARARTAREKANRLQTR